MPNAMQGGMLTMMDDDNARKGTKSMQMQNQRRRQNETMTDDRWGVTRKTKWINSSKKIQEKKRDPNGD